MNSERQLVSKIQKVADAGLKVMPVQNGGRNYDAVLHAAKHVIVQLAMHRHKQQVI